MKKSRRSQLLQHIAEITSIAIGINTDAFTISLDLNLDRANVSRMLNDLWRENILIKIQGRPTFYLHRKTLLKRYPNSYIPALIPKNEELATYLEHSLVLSQETAKEAFTSCIGHSIRESMYPIIEDIKVFLTYPQTMRSIMICGPHKSGKHHLLRCIMQYLKIDTEQLLHIDCAAIALGKLTISDIMQRIDTSLDQEKSNIILFENLDALTELPASITTMETLLRFYQRMAESNELNLLFLAVTAMNEHFLQLQKLFQKVYELPDLNSRTLKEKYEFVLYFMQNEADAIGKTISLSSSILNCFATACYPGNLQNLMQELRHALSYAYIQSSQQQETFITIDYQHLSDELLASIRNVSDILHRKHYLHTAGKKSLSDSGDRMYSPAKAAAQLYSGGWYPAGIHTPGAKTYRYRHGYCNLRRSTTGKSQSCAHDTCKRRVSRHRTADHDHADKRKIDSRTDDQALHRIPHNQTDNRPVYQRLTDIIPHECCQPWRTTLTQEV